MHVQEYALRMMERHGIELVEVATRQLRPARTDASRFGPGGEDMLQRDRLRAAPDLHIRTLRFD